MNKKIDYKVGTFLICKNRGILCKITHIEVFSKGKLFKIKTLQDDPYSICNREYMVKGFTKAYKVFEILI